MATILNTFSFGIVPELLGPVEVIDDVGGVLPVLKLFVGVREELGVGEWLEDEGCRLEVGVLLAEGLDAGAFDEEKSVDEEEGAVRERGAACERSDMGPVVYRISCLNFVGRRRRSEMGPVVIKYSA